MRGSRASCAGAGWPLMTMMGIPSVETRDRTSPPSMSGMSQSRTMTSGCSCWMRSTASAPFAASLTSNPCWFSPIAYSRRISELSSTIKTRSFPIGGLLCKIRSVARASWDEYFMGIARQAATRSTCPRKHVGAVIVRDRTVLSTGYNGSIRGLPHCEDDGCVMEDGHCITTVHAEANAILQAAKNGVSVDGAELYTTASPCWNCFKLITNVGIRKIYYGEFYRDERSRDVAKQIGIELVDLEMA